jgi:phage shock protein PspC (stress-responsive transcriptional regulator)
VKDLRGLMIFLFLLTMMVLIGASAYLVVWIVHHSIEPYQNPNT